MNINNIKVKQIIKNYKELCKLLDEPIKTGESKKIQLKDFERYMKFHKEKYSFIIDEIYKEPLPKQKDKSLNHSKYIKEIEFILVDYLSENVTYGESIQLSISSLIQILAMANKTYAKCNYKKYELAQILNMEISAISFFYNNTRSQFHQIIDRALKNLQNRSVLNVNTCYVIVQKNKDDDTYIKRKASTEEEQLIIDTQKEVLLSMKLESFKDLFLAGAKKYKEYISTLKKELPKEWQYTYKAYDLTVGVKAVAIEKEILRKQRIQLNSKIIEKLQNYLKIEDSNSNESILINALVDLTNYNQDLENQVDALYEKNKEEYYEKLKNKDKEINKQCKEKQDIKEEYDNRDNVEINEYFKYVDKIFKCDKYKKTKEDWNNLLLMIDNISK